MRKLVEDRFHEALVVPGEHGVQQRIGEPAQRGIGRDTADIHIVAGRRERYRMQPRLRFAEVAAITQTARHGEAGFDRLERQGRRRKHIPHHEGPAEIGVAQIALVVRQREFTRGKGARIARQHELAAQLGRGGRIRDHGCQIAPSKQNLRLPTHRLAVEPERGTAANEGERNEQQGSS